MLEQVPAQLDAEHAPRRPPGHRPHAPAWSVVLDEPEQTIVYSQLGVQHASDQPTAEGSDLLRALRGVLAGPHAPSVVDFAVDHDATGSRNDLALAYWQSPSQERRWRQRDDVAELWSRELEGAAGLWRETLTIPAERFETLHSTDRRGQGASHFAPIAPTDVHEYNGAARDRIAASRRDALAGEPTTRPHATGAGGGVLRPRAPGSVCFIRTAQDWSACGEREREIYISHVAPALEAGAQFLRDHPADTGCLSGRFVREYGSDGTPLDRTCFLGFFVSLAELERWTWSHATHAAIFGSFMDLVTERRGQIELALWHEVCVLDSDSIELEYRNCHSATGLLALESALA